MHRAFPLGPSAHGEKQENLQVLWAHFHMKLQTQFLSVQAPRDTRRLVVEVTLFWKPSE